MNQQHTIGGNIIKNKEDRYSYEQVFFDHLRSSGLKPATISADWENLGANYLGDWRFDWANGGHYMYYQFYDPDSSSMDEAIPATPRRFSSKDSLAKFLYANLPVNGFTGRFSGSSIGVIGYNKIDNESSFPSKLICRNSLFASMKGRRSSLTRKETGNPYAGLDTRFTAGSYFTNPTFYANLARRFVEQHQGADPGVNDDDAIWWSANKRNMFASPNDHCNITLTTNPPDPHTTTPRKAFEISSGNFVNAPLGNYSPQTTYADMFMLIEDSKNTVLSIMTFTGWREATDPGVVHPAVLVVPYVSDFAAGDYVAFKIYRIGFDTFFTESFDDSIYEVLGKAVFRRDQKPVIFQLTPEWQRRGDAMFHLINGPWVPAGGSNNKFITGRGSTNRSIDSDAAPIGGEICLRNMRTGIISPWQPLLRVLRRVKYFRWSIQPWTHK